MRHPTSATTERPRRGYGSSSLQDDFSGALRCPATEKGRQCSAVLTFKIKTLDELRDSAGEIQECPNPNGLAGHHVVIFTGKRDGNEFPFAQATYETDR